MFPWVCKRTQAFEVCVYDLWKNVLREWNCASACVCICMHMLIHNSQHRLQLHDFRCIKVSVMCNVHHVCMFVQVWKVQLLCIAVCLHVCTLMRLCVCAFVRMCVCVCGSEWAGAVSRPSQTPFWPPSPALMWWAVVNVNVLWWLWSK